MGENMKQKLRDKYSIFVYDCYNVNNNENNIEVTYVYKIDKYEFRPKIIINKNVITNKNIDLEFLDYLFFNFGMINGINYYKLTCAKKIVVNAGYLDKNQKQFFKKIFFNGLGELLYNNHLDIKYDDLLNISTIPGEKKEFKVSESFEGNLIPVGGGKDSIVTLKLLNKYKNINKCFLYKRDIYPDNIASISTIKQFGYSNEDMVEFNVTLDPLLFELNKQGFINGHIPFSSCLAFASYIMAYLTNKKYIVLSNESSANESNVKGTSINHQYSKSYEFEKDFRKYTENYFTDKIQYFSLLRCWNEFQIVWEFVKEKEYFEIFKSCNRGTKTNTWCCECPKCLYVYIMLYPYLSEEQLFKIFKSDLLNKKDFKAIFLGLVSDNYDKPFECVGTKEEINYSLSLGVEKGGKLPYLLQYYKDNIWDINKKYNVKNFYDENNFIPIEYLNLMGENKNER